MGVIAMGTYGATGFTQVVLGGIQTLIVQDTGWDRSAIALAVTLGTWTSALLSPLFGRAADRYGPRWVMPAAALMAAAGYMGIAASREVWQFYLAYIVGRSVSNPGLIGVVPRTAVVNFFRRRRGLALGLVSTFRPVGGAINIQVISLIALALTWRDAYRFLALYAALAALPILVVARRRPEDIGLLPDGDRPGDEAGPSRGPASGRRASAASEASWTARQAASTPTFWFIVMAETAIIMTSGALGFQLVPYLRDSGVSQAVAAGAFSLSNLLGAFTGPLWGYMADRVSPRRLALLAMPMPLVPVALLMLLPAEGFGFYTVVLWGMAAGGINVLGSMLLADYFGRRSFGTLSGMVGPLRLGGLGLGPTVGAVIFRLTGSYVAVFSFGLATYSLATVLVYLARRPRHPQARPVS